MAFATVGETVKFRFKDNGEVYSGVIKNYKYNNDTYNTKRRVYLTNVKNVATGESFKKAYWQQDVCVDFDKILKDQEMPI